MIAALRSVASPVSVVWRRPIHGAAMGTNILIL
jgi:hypothetical protein